MFDRNSLLLVSRVLNITGDWFYYFVITLLVFQLDSAPIFLSLLTASYILPGIIFPKLFLSLNNKRGQNFLLVIYDSFRALMIFLMIFTNNVWVLLILVFMEQILSIGSSMSFGSLVASLSDKRIASFNGNLNAWTSLTKLLIIPTFLMLSDLVQYDGLLLINCVLTIFSVILTRISRVDASSEKVNSSITVENEALTVTTKSIIAIFSIVALVRIFYDSYTLIYLKYIQADTTIGYSITTFIIGLSTIICSLLSKKIIEGLSRKVKFITTIILLLTLISMLGVLLFQNVIIFYLVVFITTFIISFYELYMLYFIQTRYGDNVQSIYSIQIFMYNLVALCSTLISGMIISSVGIRFYIFLLVIVYMISYIFILTRRWK